MRTLYVMDPLDKIDVGGDSTYMLMLEGCKRGGEVAWCTPMDLYALTGRCHARCQWVQVSEEPPYFRSKPPQDCDLSEFDVVWLRKDPPFDIGYVFSTYMLDLVESGTLVLNDPASIRDANEKMVALRYPDLVPTTLVTADIGRAMEWAASAPGKVVLKPWEAGRKAEALELMREAKRLERLVKNNRFIIILITVVIIVIVFIIMIRRERPRGSRG